MESVSPVSRTRSLGTARRGQGRGERKRGAAGIVRAKAALPARPGNLVHLGRANRHGSNVQGTRRTRLQAAKSHREKLRERTLRESSFFCGGGSGAGGIGSSPRKRGGVVAQAKPDFGDRIIACVPYLLPLLDGLRYGKFFFMEFPQAYVLLAPLQPLIKAYYTLPFASLVVFFGLYYGIVQNYNFSRFIRFQAMQTILLDILLIVPSLLENFLLRDVPKSGAYLQFLITSYNFVFLYVAVCFLYGVAASLAGEQARLPGVADAADRQVM